MKRPLLLVVAVLTLTLFGPQASAAPQASFDPARALAVATQLAATIGERPAGSLGEQKAAGWLAGQFAGLGYEVQVQAYPLSRFGASVAGMNVVATKAGAPDYGTIYVGAHYDTVYRLNNGPYGGPGANDNASGTGVLLELARVVAGDAFSPTLKFIAFGAEEDGLVGSRFYVNTMPFVERMQAEGMLNLDCVGLGEILTLYYGREEDRAFVERLGLSADAVELLVWGGSDHQSFVNVGIPAVFLNTEPGAGGVCGPDYHKPTDTVEKLELTTLGRVGIQTERALRTLAERAELRSLYWRWLPFIQLP